MPIEATQAWVLLPPPPLAVLLLPLLPHAATARAPSAVAAITTVPFIKDPPSRYETSLGKSAWYGRKLRTPWSAECWLIKPLRRMPGKRSSLIFERQL
jgi:hypothetical protein